MYGGVKREGVGCKKEEVLICKQKKFFSTSTNTCRSLGANAACESALREKPHVLSTNITSMCIGKDHKEALIGLEHGCKCPLPVIQSEIVINASIAFKRGA